MRRTEAGELSFRRGSVLRGRFSYGRHLSGSLHKDNAIFRFAPFRRPLRSVFWQNSQPHDGWRPSFCKDFISPTLLGDWPNHCGCFPLDQDMKTARLPDGAWKQRWSPWKRCSGWKNSRQRPEGIAVSPEIDEFSRLRPNRGNAGSSRMKAIPHSGRLRGRKSNGLCIFRIPDVLRPETDLQPPWWLQLAMASIAIVVELCLCRHRSVLSVQNRSR